MGSLSSSKRNSFAPSVSISMAYEFSWSSDDDRGVALWVVVFPWLIPSLSARRSGLLGDVLRALARMGAFRRRVNLFLESVTALALNARDSPDGESGVLGDFLFGDLVVV